ncbi:MAG: M48 family metallopeptidase [Myxococcales bacterium]|nr:M48 family metallopeptidase [Myxococcales bacterium]USN50878.1 MAG: M48 family metallopeptidase [Myxococcales bacterium]
MNIFDNWFFVVFLIFYLAYLLVEIGLDLLNIRHVDQHKSHVPDLFKGIYSETDYKKSIDYTKAKTNFKIFTLILKTAFVFTLILSGFFGHLDTWLSAYFSNTFWRGVIYPFAVGGVFFVFGIPQSYFYQFVLEEKFGFNRMNFKTFVLDQIKGALLGLLFGVPLIAALLWIIGESGPQWWIFGFALVMGFQLFTAAIYPVFLAPIFNKFSPLADGSLKTRIEDLAKKVNFKMAGIFTIDGSKRSSHSNAFFAGLGSMRRIVLFDTLIEKHSEDEIVGVIAHEMGHNVKKHIQKSLVLSSVIMLALFYVLSLCIQWPPFFTALGAFQPSIHVGLVLFALFSSVFMFPISPIFTKISRHNEFEADEFSVHTTRDKKHLADALVKLTKENLGNLTPHPWYSAYHYSHPTTLERVKAIEAVSLD